MGAQQAASVDAAQLAQKLVGLGNDLLQVEALAHDLIEFRHTSEAKSLFGMKKKSFLGRAKLEADKRKISYWQTVEEGSAGFSFGSEGSSSSTRGSNMVKFSGFVVKDVDPSGSGVGFQPDGARFKYDLAQVRGLVRSIASESGWGFGDAWTMPK